jgi:RimJ/RimL family protein N-acetyltransferase
MTSAERTQPARPITAAGLSDLADFSAHVVRHIAESETKGGIHFSPVWDVDRSDVMRETERRWRTPPHQPGWGRAWLLWTHVWNDPSEARPQVVGHVELRGGVVPSALHRVELSVGIEAPYRGRGAGGALMRSAIAWTREIASVAFVDLRVFAPNVAARALYRKLGFDEIGVVRDAYRMRDGTSIDDIFMTLPLRAT